MLIMVLVLYDYEILIEMASEIVSVRSPSHALMLSVSYYLQRLWTRVQVLI